MLRRLRFRHVVAAFLLIAAGCTAFHGDPAAPDADAGTDAAAISDSTVADEKPLEHDAGPDSAPDAAPDAGSAYANVVLGSSPVAYWRLDEKTGDIALDIAGNSHRGTYVQPVSLGREGAIGENSLAVSFQDGGRVTIGDVFDFAQSVPFSVEMWLAVAQLPSAGSGGYGESYMVSKFTKNGGGWHVFLVNDGRVGFNRKLTDGAIQEVISSSPVLQPNAMFHHLVATFDGTNGRLYFDAALVGEHALDGALPDTATPLFLGREDNGEYDFPFHGLLDEVALYDKMLSVADIAKHYATGKIGH